MTTLTSRDRWIPIALCLWLATTGLYGSFCWQWSMDGDEVYTYIDSSKPIPELLSYERKPLYYLICHALLNSDVRQHVPLEVLLRLPAVIAGGLIAPIAYLLLRSRENGSGAIPTSLMLGANPWIFESSIQARYYSLAFLLAMTSILCLYRWLAKPYVGWLIAYAVIGVGAALAHSTAAIVFPAGLLALGLAMLREHPQLFTTFLRRYALVLGGGLVLATVVGLGYLNHQIQFWLHSKQGEFGNYSLVQLLISAAIFGGMSNWALALFPLLKHPQRWNGDDCFLGSLVVLSFAPFLIMVPLGGGVSGKYVMACLPAVFILAGRHWAQLSRSLETWGQHLGFTAALLAVNTPYMLSILVDGDHYDFRSAAQFVDRLQLENPIILSTSHQMLGHYLSPHVSAQELGKFEAGINKQLIEQAIQQSKMEQRPLIMVSWEDRKRLSPEDQAWISDRFALIRSIDKARFDHRRILLSIYQYRPKPSVDDHESTTDPCNRSSHPRP